MANGRNNPAFNLKVVVRETGVKADTLRAWERRYGLPDPARTDGGHRLYSQHDINMIKWLVARQQEGMNISHAVDLWRTLEEDGKDPLQAMPTYVGAATRPAIQSDMQGDVLENLREKWLSACLKFDEQQADAVLTEALSLFPPEIVLQAVLQKGLSDIGDMWYEGEISVQQEHFTSALAARRTEALIAAAPSPVRPGRIIVACPPQEQHTFGSLQLTLMLKRQGWDALYLGANVPIDRLRTTIELTEAQLVILSAMQLHTAATLRETALAIADTDVAIGFGGRIFDLVPEIADRIPGIYLGSTMTEVTAGVEDIMLNAPDKLTVDSIPEAYMETLRHFHSAKPHIEADMWQMLQEEISPDSYLVQANASFNQAVEASLLLGDPSLIEIDIDWIEGLLENQHISPQLLHRYIESYLAAVEKHLGERGQIITETLASLQEKIDV